MIGFDLQTNPAFPIKVLLIPSINQAIFFSIADFIKAKNENGMVMEMKNIYSGDCSEDTRMISEEQTNDEPMTNPYPCCLTLK